MAVISDAIVSGIAWEAFSQSYGFYSEKINDFVLRVYIAQQLKAMENFEEFSSKQLEEMTDVIETTVIETPEEIKQMDDPKEAFQKYFKEKPAIRTITAENYFEKIVVKDNATANFNFGGGSPKQ